MKKQLLVFKTIFLAVLILTAGFAFADDEGKKIFFRYCSTCHSPDWALNAVKSEENWKLTVQRMSLQYKMFIGEEIPLNEQEAILEYLRKETDDSQGSNTGN